MDWPLLISSIIEHAAAYFGDTPIVSRETHGPIVRYRVADCAHRARQLANALQHSGLSPGDVVGTIAWNNGRHLEAYFAVSGSGMVIHTCNPRLHPDQLVYIINHADDRAILFDASFAPLIEGIAARCPRVKSWICLCDADHAPKLQEPRVECYEELIAAHDAKFAWPQFDERTAAVLCYTSGTTGNPKGAIVSHRAIVLNAITICMPDVLGLSASETILPIVPMFHVNAWCAPYAAMLSGAKLVLAGPRLDGASLYELMEAEQVTVTAGVPTMLQGLAAHLEQNDLRLSTLKRAICGGSALPPALLEILGERHGVEMRHGWGMTETTAVATLNLLDPAQSRLPKEQRSSAILKQGKPVFGIDIKIIDANGAALPHDGKTQGELLVRGQWIVSGYFKSDTSPLIDGWFPTGDVATIDAQGVMQITDRIKDLIKTGGEWISSIDLENAASSHPCVAAVAVIGVKHPKWVERPLIFVVRKPGRTLEREEMLEFLRGRVARLCVPDEVIFLETLPLGGTGKVQKALLREKYGEFFNQGKESS